jgi:hypothetical protein
MLTLLLTANALLTIIWILTAMQKNAHPVTALAALAWLLAYICAPQALLIVAAVLNPIALVLTTLLRSAPTKAFQTDPLGTCLGTGIAVPDSARTPFATYPAHCFVGA